MRQRRAFPPQQYQEVEIVPLNPGGAGVLSGLEPVSPPVKTPRVFAQNGGFVFLLEILSF